MSEWNYILAAYAVTWIGIVGYAIHVARRLRRAAIELNDDGASAGSETER